MSPVTWPTPYVASGAMRFPGDLVMRLGEILWMIDKIKIKKWPKTFCLSVLVWALQGQSSLTRRLTTEKCANVFCTKHKPHFGSTFTQDFFLLCMTYLTVYTTQYTPTYLNCKIEHWTLYWTMPMPNTHHKLCPQLSLYWAFIEIQNTENYLRPQKV